MSGITLDITGLDDAIKSLDIVKLKEPINKALYAFGVGTVTDAQQFCPVDEGYLRQTIGFDYGDLFVNVSVTADYAGYVEFGTRKFAAEVVASLPSEWQEMASQMRGSGGGSFQEFIEALIGWVQRKGITGSYSVKTRKRVGGKANIDAENKQAAYMIALSILRNGSPAQPFLFPAYEKNLLALKDNLLAL